VELQGRIVIELSHAVPRKPFFLGFQAYFSNLPYLDIQMTGMKGLLNVSFTKHKILEVVSHKLKDHMVLPQRITKTLEPIKDLISLKSPHPEGILRVRVAGVRGMMPPSDRNANAFRTRSVHFQIDCGIASFRSGSKVGDVNGECAEPSTGDFLILDSSAQRLHIMLRLEEPVLMGHASSVCLGWCSLPTSLLIVSSSEETWDRWWPLELEGDKDEKVKTDKSMPLDEILECLSKSAVGMGSDVRAPNGYDSYDANRPDEALDALGPCVRILTAWRPFHRDAESAKRLMKDSEAHGRWHLESSSEKDGIVAFAQLGARHVSGLPKEFKGKLLQCVVECSHQDSKHARPLKSKKLRCELITPCICGRAISGHHSLLARGSKYCVDCGRDISKDSSREEVCAVFDHPFDFHLHDPHRAQVSISVYSEVSDKVEAHGNKKADAQSLLGSAVLDVTRFLTTEVQSVPLSLPSQSVFSTLRSSPALTCQFKFCVLAPSKADFCDLSLDNIQVGLRETSC